MKAETSDSFFSSSISSIIGGNFSNNFAGFDFFFFSSRPFGIEEAEMKDSISVEVLRTLLLFLSSSDVKRLEACGSHALNAKIREATLFLRLSKRAGTHFPLWAFNYPNLESLQIDTIGTPIFSPLAWGRVLPLPSKAHTALKVLKLHFLGSALLLTPLAAPNTLASMCPNLETLECSIFGPFDHEEIGNLPLKLKKLRLVATSITAPVTLNYGRLALLPRTIESLELVDIHLKSEENEKFGSEIWPPVLKRLVLRPAMESQIRNLPDSIETLELDWNEVPLYERFLRTKTISRSLTDLTLLHASEGEIILDSPLPPSLTRLSTDCATYCSDSGEEIGPENISDLHSLFPSSITEFEAHPRKSLQLALLPTFNLLKSLTLDASLAQHIENSLEPKIYFPTKLTSLETKDFIPSPRLLKLLPPSVTRIAAPISRTDQCDSLGHLIVLRHLTILPTPQHTSSIPNQYATTSSSSLAATAKKISNLSSNSTVLPSSFWKKVCPTLQTLSTPISRSLESFKDGKAPFLLSPSASRISTPQPAKEWALLGTKLKTFELTLSAKEASEYRPETVLRLLPTSITSLRINIEDISSMSPLRTENTGKNSSSVDSSIAGGKNFESENSVSSTSMDPKEDGIGNSHNSSTREFTLDKTARYKLDEGSPDWFAYLYRFYSLESLHIRDERMVSRNFDSEVDRMTRFAFLEKLPISLKTLVLELGINTTLPDECFSNLPPSLISLSVRRISKNQRTDGQKSNLFQEDFFLNLPTSLLVLNLECQTKPTPKVLDLLPKSLMVFNDSSMAWEGPKLTPAKIMACKLRSHLESALSSPKGDLYSAIPDNEAFKEDEKEEENLYGENLDNNRRKSQRIGNLKSVSNAGFLDKESVVDEDDNDGRDEGDLELEVNDFVDLMDEEEHQLFLESQRQELRKQQAIAKARILLEESKTLESIRVASEEAEERRRREKNSEEGLVSSRKALDQHQIDESALDELLDEDLGEREYEGFWIVPRSPVRDRPPQNQANLKQDPKLSSIPPRRKRVKRHPDEDENGEIADTEELENSQIQMEKSSENLGKFQDSSFPVLHHSELIHSIDLSVSSHLPVASDALEALNLDEEGHEVDDIFSPHEIQKISPRAPERTSIASCASDDFEIL